MVTVVQLALERAALCDVVVPHLAHGNGGTLGSLLLALYLAGVLPAIQHHGKVAGFGAGQFNAP